jgi:NAD(P)-dependent dehydrogenase (short-subunit alcohol dehydrogenase family)
MANIQGKVVAVTGAAGALGSAVVARFLEAGARVAAIDLEPALARLQPDPELLLLPADMDREQGAAAAMAAVVERFGRIDGLLCLAGGFFGDVPVADTPPARVREQMALNLMTAYTAVHAALPHMLEAGGGSIVCVGSRPAVRPVAGSVAYAASKLAVLKVVELVSEEYRDRGIRANAILPSIIDTPANRQAMPKADFDRWVKPEQIAAVLQFLISDDSAPINGAHIPVYGRA